MSIFCPLMYLLGYIVVKPIKKERKHVKLLSEWLFRSKLGDSGVYLTLIFCIFVKRPFSAKLTAGSVSLL